MTFARRRVNAATTAARRLALTGFALLTTTVAACATREAQSAATAPVEEAVAAARSLQHLSGTYRIDSISIESRAWSPSAGVPAIGNFVSAFNALPTTGSGFTNAPWYVPSLTATVWDIYDGGFYKDTTWFGVVNPAGAHNNIALRYHIAMTALTPAVLNLQFGVDALGAAMYVDGALVAQDLGNPFWKGNFVVDTNSWAGCTDATYGIGNCVPKWGPAPGVFAPTLTLTAGRHVVEVIGFEDGNDFGAGARIDAGAGFQYMVAANLPSQTLTVTPPTGGTIVSSPAGINCPSTCTASFPSGTAVTLTATASGTNSFNGWTGACSGNATCTLSMYLPKSVAGTFSAPPSVTGMTYESRYWSGAAFTPTGAAVTSFFNALPTTTAGYTNEPVPVTTYVTNAGFFTAPQVGAVNHLAERYVTTMSVTGSSNVDLRFGADLSAGGVMLVDGTEVAANWTGSAGDVFLTATVAMATGTHTVTVIGFEDCCDGRAAKLEYNYGAGWVTATAPALPTIPLTIAVPTSGGTVTSSPAGINCGPTCQANFATGSQVNLTATPAQYFAFTSWGGACTGAGACSIRMLAPSRAATANFTRIAWPVTVTTAGTGTGTITASPAGASCGTNCFTWAPGTSVTFTVTPDANSAVSSWNVAGCTGNTCTTTVNSALTVTATIGLKQVALTVTKSGTGTGTVTSSPAGINCGTACTASFGMGTNVALTATAAAGSQFTGWAGACTGTGACSVPLTAAATVSASFKKLADATGPVMSCKADPIELWPVNHKMKDITVTMSIADAESGVSGFQLVSVTANEPVNYLGDGNTKNDIQGWTIGTADLKGQLRAERRGGDKDRIYTLLYKGFDKSGNSSTASCKVTVPHDRGDDKDDDHSDDHSDDH